MSNNSASSVFFEAMSTGIGIIKMIAMSKDSSMEAVMKQARVMSDACGVYRAAVNNRTNAGAFEADIDKMRDVYMLPSQQEAYNRILAAAHSSDEGFVISNGRNNAWRTWGDSGPEWTPDYAKALRFARRADAETFARNDEDAWHIQPFVEQPGAARCSVCLEPQFDTPSGVSCINGHGGVSAAPL